MITYSRILGDGILFGIVELLGGHRQVSASLQRAVSHKRLRVMEDNVDGDGCADAHLGLGGRGVGDELGISVARSGDRNVTNGFNLAVIADLGDDVVFVHGERKGGRDGNAALGGLGFLAILSQVRNGVAGKAARSRELAERRAVGYGVVSLGIRIFLRCR